MSRSNNLKKQLFNIVKIIVTLLAVLIIVSCPEPMSDDLLAEVDDVAAPVITITSPDLSVQNFIESAVTITGTIKDFSDSAGKILGSVVSASYADKYGFLGISDVVSIGSDGSFTINFSSVTLLDTFTIVITVIDWNGNTSTKDITYWKDSSGPYIVVTDHDSTDYNVYSSALSTPYTISGQMGTDSIKLRYDIEWSGTNVLDATPTNIDYSAGTFSFDFIPTSYSGTLTFWLKATDDNTNTTNKLFSLINDPVKPIISSHSFPADNTTLTAILSEGIYTSAAGATGTNIVSEADFDLELDGVPLTWSFSTSPAEGETSLNISFSGIPATPDGSEVLTFAPISDEVFDRVGNPADPAVFLITENLHDKQAPALVSVGQTDAKEITVVFSEDVSGGALNASNYENGTGVPASSAVYGGNNSTVILTYPDDIVTASNLNIAASVITDADGNLFTGAADYTISDEFAPYIKDIKVWDISGGSYVSTGLFNASQDLYIDVVFSEPVTGTTAPTLMLSGGSITAGFDSLITTTSTNDTVRYSYDITNGDSDSLLDISSLSGGNLTDISLNSANLSTSGTFSETIEIDAVDPAVTIDTGTVIYLNLSGNLYATASDTDSGLLSLTWSGPGAVTFGDSSLEDTTVTASTEGTYTLTLTVVDNAGNSASDTIDLVWDITNPYITSMGSNLILNSSGGSIDATAGDGLSGIVSWAWSSSPSGVTFGTPSSEDTTITGSSSEGTFAIMLTVEDAAGNINNDTISMIWDISDPTVSAGDDKTAGSQIDLNSISGSDNDASATDVGDAGIDNTTYSWTEEGSNKVTITNPNYLNPTINVPDDTEGDYILRLTVYDNAGNFSSDDMILTWDNGPELTNIDFADGGSNPGAGAGDTITFTFDEAIDKSTVGIGPSNKLTDTLANLLLEVGSFNNGFTSETDNTSEMVYSDASPYTLIITLGGVTVNGTQPGGVFTAKGTITDISTPSNFIHDITAAALNGSWDSTVPQVDTITATPSGDITTATTTSIDIVVTYSEPIDTAAFTENTTVSYSAGASGATVTTSNGAWSVGDTVYTKTYSVTTASGNTGTFTVTASGASDIYGNVQSVTSNVLVTIAVP